MDIKNTIKIAIVISHPIQHFCPQYATYAKLPELSIKVFFASEQGMKPYKDKNFNQTITWGNLYLKEFQHDFLQNLNIPADRNIDSENLEDRLREYNPDYVMIYGYIQKLQRRAYRWALSNKKELIYISDSELSAKKNDIVFFIKRLFLRRYFSKISFFLTVGDSNEFYYRLNGVPSTKLFRTFFPIDVRTFKSAIKEESQLKKSFRQNYNLEENNFILSTVGKLIEIKRQADVIKSLILMDHLPIQRIVYFVIGDGPDMENLKKLAEKLNFHRVVFTGFTSPDDLPPYYLATDIYVHPSSKEPHSLSISEAIFCGCPVILSNTCGSHGPTDDVQIGSNGFVFPVGNYDVLVAQIRFLMNNPDILKSFSLNSTRKGESNQKLAHGAGLLCALNSKVL